MRTPVEGNDSDVMNDLHQNHHVPGGLNNPVTCGERTILAVVIEARKHWRPAHRKHETALRRRSIFRTVCGMLSGINPFGLYSLLRLRSERRDFSVGRIGGDGSSEVPCAPGVGLPPDIVVSANDFRGPP